MKFKFIISKWANFYFFLHNIADLEWPWRSRRLFKKQLWKKHLGSLSKEEKKALVILKEIYLKYVPKKYLGKPFFLEKNPWKGLEEEILKEEVLRLKKVFSVWKERFEKIYSQDLPNLERWKKELQLQMGNPEIKKINNFIQAKASILYNAIPPKTIIIKVYLMLNDSEMGISGHRGKGLDEKSIMLELSGFPIQKINNCLAILWHEIIHCCYSSVYFLPLLKRIPKTRRVAAWLEELNVRSLLGRGIWDIKFFNRPLPLTLNPSPPKIDPRLNSIQTIEIINLADQYIKENKRFNKDYIEKFIQILKRNKKWAILLKR